MLKQGTLVQVDWLDAQAVGEWTFVKDVELAPPVVHSVGYVLADTEAALVLAADVGAKYGPDDSVNRSMVIPRGMVQKVRKLA